MKLFNKVTTFFLLSINFSNAATFTDSQLENACRNAREYNKNNNIPAAYTEFAKLGDTYAEAATKIFDTSKDSLERCVIQAHWLNVVGEKEKEKNYDRYGKQYQSNYINLVCKEKKLPKTDRIEKLYGDTLKDMHLPDELSIDKVLNRQPRNSMFRYIQNGFCNIMVGRGLDYKNGEWYDAISLRNEPERHAIFQNKADISEHDADWLAFKTSMRTGLVSKGCFEVIAKSFTKAAYQEAATTAKDVLTNFFHSFGNPPTKGCGDNPRKHSL